MLKWALDFTLEAENDLARLDRKLQKRIIDKLSWLQVNFDKISPSALDAEWRGFFKLRVGEWRIIYEVNWNKKLIIVRVIDRRDKIYKRKKLD